jgi:threonine dehydratase
VLLLDPAARARGLVAASAGNHAQGVALAAKLSGTAATIVMPVGTALIKVRRTEGYGARVVLHGESYDEAAAHARVLATEEGLTPIHPFDDFHVMAGQGTLALEILEQVPDVDTLVVPVGGGGLVAGMALALAALRPDVRIVGVQAAGAAPLVASFHAGRRIEVEHPTTIAEGIRVGRAGTQTFDVVRDFVDEMVTVEEEHIALAMVQALSMSKVVPEAAGVAAIAALSSGRVAASGKICAVVSGGNIDLALLSRLIESGLAQQGFYHLVVVRLEDKPGQLERIVKLLSSTGCNIVSVDHLRAGWKVPVGHVDVEVLLETRHEGQGAENSSFWWVDPYKFRRRKSL